MGDFDQAFEQKFKDAFERYSDELFRHASMRLSDRDRAEELTQDAFMRTWDYVRKGGEVRDLRPFLYQTLRNLIIDEYRKAKIHSLDSMLENAESGQMEAMLPQDDTNTIEAAMERLDAKEALRRVDELSEVYREVVLLRYVEGLSPKEIGAIVGESENVVSVRIHRALKKMRDLLEEKDLGMEK
ncbi:MAG TPA: RNA polymerase sigma factor [Candidatus Paceibacterota bacterium]|nr:RNA polymerase sigma factor [Candidatus Paceibacterota bacterium]